MLGINGARGSLPWRAARLAACLAALRRHQAPPDDVLMALATLGDPPTGWLDIVGGVRARATSTIALVLMRPGDPRGLALPRGTSSVAAVGWGDQMRGSWLIGQPEGNWTLIDATERGVPLVDPVEADRALRQAIVDVAHVLDHAVPLESMEASGRVRSDAEDLIDSWLLTEPALPVSRRSLAARGLRMLAAAEAAAAVDVLDEQRWADFDRAARGAVEAAFGWRASESEAAWSAHRAASD